MTEVLVITPHSTMAPALFILSLFVLSATCANDNCANKDNCNAEAENGHLAAIYCKDGGCTCVPGTGKCDGLTLPNSLTDGDSCKAFCKDNPVPQPDGNTTTQCVFYKFQQVGVCQGSN